MTGDFGPRANLIARASVAGAVLLLLAVCGVTWGYVQSQYNTKVKLFVNQEVPFSHAHHVGGLGIDCRYCHTAVEQSADAGMPTSDVCMNCHLQIWTNAELLAPVRESWRAGQPLVWNKVNVIPDFVYFNHSIHVAKGVGCAECHGRVDQMPLAYKANTFHMAWCLNCHRDPGPRLRPQDRIYDMGWERPRDTTPAAWGAAMLERYDVATAGLTNCTKCHR